MTNSWLNLSNAKQKSVSNYRQTSDPNFAVIADDQPGAKIILDFYNLGVSECLKIGGILNILLIIKDWSKFQVAMGNIYIFDGMYDCVLIELCCELSYPFEIIRFIEEGSGNSYR